MLSLKVGRQRITVPISSLRHANARDHFVFVTLTDGRELKCYMTFGEMLAMLEGEPRFLVCNRGVLINMDQVRSFDGECFTMNGGQRFAVRLSRKNADRPELLPIHIPQDQGGRVACGGRFGAAIFCSCCFAYRRGYCAWRRCVAGYGLAGGCLQRW